MEHVTGIIRPPNAHIIENGAVDAADAEAWLLDPDIDVQPDDLFVVEGIGFSFADANGDLKLYRKRLKSIRECVSKVVYLGIHATSPYSNYGHAWNTFWLTSTGGNVFAAYCGIARETPKRSIAKKYFDIFLEKLSPILAAAYKDSIANVQKAMAKKSFSVGFRGPIDFGQEEVFLRDAISHFMHYATEAALDKPDNDYLLYFMRSVHSGIQTQNNLSDQDAGTFFENFIRSNITIVTLLDAIH